jgi:DNA repair protein RadD
VSAPQIDAGNVRMAGGDFVARALASVADKPELVREACAEIVRLGAARKSWLAFAVTVEHATHIRDELRNAHGIDCDIVSAKTPKGERERLIRAFRAGRLRCLVNVAVLTTGFDAPEVDLIALLRPTRSPVLYVQIAGRGMRTAPGKADCLWLDFTDTTSTLGPVDAIKGRAKNPPSTANAPVKHCDECGAPNHTGARECVECGHLFPAPAVPDRVKHAVTPASAAVLSDGGIVWQSVSAIEYRRHHGREGKPDSMRVDYYAGFRRLASEWVCVEHEGGARRKAEAWWVHRATTSAPATVDEALERTQELREPGRVALRQAGQWLEVISHEFKVPA